VKALITGGTGFVGGALTRRLHGMGWDVTALGRNPKILDELEAQGIKTIQANIEKKELVMDACRDMEIVFHCAAFPSPWGNFEKFYQTNVIGTRNVVQACIENKVKRLVYVSTPSIYFDYGSRMQVKESEPLPEPISNYSSTKLLAEEEIDKGFATGLPVVSIRPRAIFGPGDTVIFPRVIPRLKSGRLPIIGDGENVIDLTFIENVVDALVLCAESSSNTLGKKYNISNDEPVKIWQLIDRICTELDMPHPKRKVPRRLVHAAGGLLEFLFTLIPTHPEPPLTRLSVMMMSNSTTLDITAAKKELNYKPRVSVDEGVELFLKWWKEIMSLRGR